MTKVYVEWYDSYSVDPWHNIDQAIKATSELCICKTFGWLLNETDTHIVICHTHNSDDQVTGCLHIPLSCIKKIKRIK